MREQILKLADELLTPIGWYGEKGKEIDGLDKFVEKVEELFIKEKEEIEP